MSTSQVPTQKIIRRKVQVVGGNTITVSLPRSWADKNRLGRDLGQEQEVSMRYMADGSLLMSAANSHQQVIERDRSHKIDPDTTLDTIKRILIADFMGGIDIIKLRPKKPLPHQIVEEVRDFVDKRLIGFDLIETTHGLDVINMTQSPKFNVDRLLEIIRVQSKKMMENCYLWLKDDNIDRVELAFEMRSLEVSLDKRANQMMRTLQLSILDYWMAENVNLPMAEILYWSTTTKAAENASDLAVAITEVSSSIDLDKLSQEHRQDVFEFGDHITHLFSDALKSFIDRDYQKAHEILEEQHKLSIDRNKGWPIKTKDQLEGNMLLVLHNFVKIGNYARKIAEAVVDCEAARIAYHAYDTE